MKQYFELLQTNWLVLCAIVAVTIAITIEGSECFKCLVYNFFDWLKNRK